MVSSHSFFLIKRFWNGGRVSKQSKKDKFLKVGSGMWEQWISLKTHVKRLGKCKAKWFKEPQLGDTEVIAPYGQTLKLSCFVNINRKELCTTGYLSTWKQLTRFSRVLTDKYRISVHLFILLQLHEYMWCYFFNVSHPSLSSTFPLHLFFPRFPLLFAYRIFVCGSLHLARVACMNERG